MKQLTTSAMRAFRRCHRLYYIQYYQGYRVVSVARPLSFGTAMHAALEVWMSSHDLDASLAAIRCDEPFDQVRAEELMQGYHARWHLEPHEVLCVETPFDTPVVNPKTARASATWTLSGKIDGLVRVDGHVLLLEHKTTSEDISRGSTYWQRLELDSQISTYYVGARALGYEPAGCLYDVIRRPSIRPRDVPVLDDDGKKIVVDSTGERVRTKDGKRWRETGDSALGYVQQVRPETIDEYRNRLRADICANPDAYFARGIVNRLQDDETDAAIDTWDIAKAIRQAEIANRWPRNPDACMHWGRVCDFWPVCTRMDSLENKLLYRKTRMVNEELVSTSF